MAKKDVEGKSDIKPHEDFTSKMLLEKINVICRSLGVLAMRFSPTRPKTDNERIHFLQSLGFDRNEIAAILSTTPGTVSVRLSESKSKKGKGQKGRGKNK
jgi:hypothetical protein